MKVTVTCGRKFHSDHLAAALLRKGALEKVITANPPSQYRRYDFPPDKIYFTLPLYVPGWLAGRTAVTRFLEPGLNWWATRWFDRLASRRIGDPDVVLAWAWSALTTFQSARAAGKLCVLEECGSANAHQEAVLAEEYRLLGIPRKLTTPRYVIDNERAECDLADVILCPSEYVARSFSIYGIPREKCLVIPYASDPRLFAVPKVWNEKKLEILYVGSVGPRKGLIYLLKALRELPPEKFNCTVIGRVEPGFEPVLAPFRNLFHHIPSVPHAELPKFYQRASVFVLPTLDEGMAYVISEALASGTPVITTPNSGAEGTIKQGENGFIVPIRDPEAIAAILNELMAEPEVCRRMSLMAQKTAVAWDWDEYAIALLANILRFQS